MSLRSSVISQQKGLSVCPWKRGNAWRAFHNRRKLVFLYFRTFVGELNHSPLILSMKECLEWGVGIKVR